MENEQWPEPVEWYNRYEIGVRQFPAPDEQEMRHMFFLVAYDICQPGRLRKVAKVCELYGVRIEKSVFQCDIPHKEFEALWCEVIDLIAEEEDSVLAYRICASCLKEAESAGVVPRPQKRLYYIV